MPTFCRHNRFLQNCPICRRELESDVPAPARPRRPGAGARAGFANVRVRRAARPASDGYRSELAPGLRAAGDARRLAEELAFAAGRLRELERRPPGSYAEVAAESDVEEAAWLAFLIAYLCPLEDEDPFAAIEAARTSWSGGGLPDLQAAVAGPRSAHDPGRGQATPEAYRRWAQRAGSQAAAYLGDPHWTPQRRFARAFERLALPGLHRAARFDLLLTLGALGRFELSADSLFLAGADDDTAIAAKRVFGIADSLLIDRRARALAEATGVPVGALDLALYNWQRPEQRAMLGADRDTAEHGAQIAAALGL